MLHEGRGGSATGTAVSRAANRPGGAFLDITVKGRGAHGAWPNSAVDPVIASCHICTALQTIVARNLPPAEPAKLANSDAVALTSYLQGLGIGIDADRANKLLVLLAVLMIECGSGLALAVGMALGDSSRHATETQKRDGVPTARRAVSQGVPNACHQAFPSFQSRSVQQQLQEQPEPLDQRLLRVIVERGGTLIAGQREIGRLIGVSASHAHRLLHDLFGAGVISLAPGRTGTVVKRIVN